MATIAFLLASEYEDSEMDLPYQAVKKAGHDAVIISLKKGELLRGKQGRSYYVSELAIAEANPIDFEAVVIPGGRAPLILMEDMQTTEFVQKIHEAGKLVAGICYGPLVMVRAGILQGRKATSEAEIKEKVVQAGATFVDEPVVVDGNLITLRSPEDAPFFIEQILAKL